MTERLRRMLSGCGKAPDTRDTLDATVKSSNVCQRPLQILFKTSAVTKYLLVTRVPTVLLANPIHPPDPDQGFSTL